MDRTTPATPAPVEPTKRDAFVAAVAQRIAASDFYVGTAGFIAQALLADTLEAATDTEDLWNAENHLGERLTFLGATFADSDLPGTLPFYAVIDVRDATTGDVAKMACGGDRVVATLFRACEMGWFPFDAYIVAIPLEKGKQAFNLQLAPKQVENTA